MNTVRKFFVFIASMFIFNNIYADRIVDEVHLYHNKTIKAIRMCQRAVNNDQRCQGQRGLYCGPCSQISHSDHSSYKVFRRNGGGHRQVTRNCEAYEVSNTYNSPVINTYYASARGRRGTGVKQVACDKALNKCQNNKHYYNYCSLKRNTNGGHNRRTLVDTFHFNNSKTALAVMFCNLSRSNMAQCNSIDYVCTPCTIVPHSDHSQFSLYRVNNRRRY